jgi:hypothetical protein
MISQRKIDANWRNAAKSTGPRTERGKSKVRLKELDSTPHLIGFVDFPDEDQTPDDLTQTERILGTIDDARVLGASRLEAEKIGVVSDYHAVLGEPIRGLLFILGFKEPCFLRGGDIDAAAPKSVGDGGVATLIQVVANRPSHWPS